MELFKLLFFFFAEIGVGGSFKIFNLIFPQADARKVKLLDAYDLQRFLSDYRYGFNFVHI